MRKFFNPYEHIVKTKNRLPHWQQSGAVYFVTWHLGDSIPKAKRDRLYRERKQWLSLHPKPWSRKTEQKYHRLFSTKIDEWLDAGEGSCLLRKQENAEIVKEALEFFEGEKSTMLSFVVMPNMCTLCLCFIPDVLWKAFYILGSVILRAK